MFSKAEHFLVVAINHLNELQVMFRSRTNGCTTGLLNFHSILGLGSIPYSNSSSSTAKQQTGRGGGECVAESLGQIAAFEARKCCECSTR